MSARRSLVFVVSVAMLVLATLAYASDVDPGWGGLYDDDDGDNVILFITITMAGVEPAVLTRIDHPPILVGAVVEHVPSDPVRVCLSRPDSRAPPSL